MRVRGVDAGGSQTRIAKNKNEILFIKSPCMEIPVDAPVKGHIIKNAALDFVVKKSPCEALLGRRFVRDEACNQYNGDILVCDNTEVKVLQEITYINILYAIAVDCVNRGLNDESFFIGLCIPAAEYYDDENDRIGEVKDNLAGDTAIYFPMLDRTIRFHIDKKNIGVVAEGVVAAFRFQTDRNFVYKNSLIIDVGYRSTDITILMNFDPVGAGAASRPIGGINLEANIQSKLERDNIFVSTEVIQKALSTIYVVDKTTDELIDVTDYIMVAKESNASDYLNKALDLARQDSFDFTRGQLEVAVRSHYLISNAETIDITPYVHAAKEVFVDVVYKAALNVAAAKMLNIGDISNVFCVGRPFSGDPEDQYNLVNLLRRSFRNDINMYVVPDAGTANVVEIVNLLQDQAESDV